MARIANFLGSALIIALLFTTLLILDTESSQAQLIYSHDFTQGTVYGAGTPQYDDWISFRASLPTEGIVSINLSGSRDPIGRSCNDPNAAQQIADALRDAGAGNIPTDTVLISIECSGLTWTIVACDFVQNNTMLKPLGPGDSLTPCSCDATYALGPAITDGDWGGIDGPICTAESQTIIVSVELIPSSIPALSEWGYMVLASVLGIVGFMVIRRKKATA